MKSIDEKRWPFLFWGILVIPILLAMTSSCATTSDRLSSGQDQYVTGNLYIAILEWQKIPTDHPDYALARENIEKAERQLTVEVDTKLQVAGKAITRGDLPGAVEAYDKAYKADPRRGDIASLYKKTSSAAALVENHERQARKKIDEEDLQGALEEYKIILTIIPEYGPAREGLKGTRAKIVKATANLFNEGQEKLRNGDKIGAKRDFLQVLRLDPTHRGAREFFWSSRRDVLPKSPGPSEYFFHTIEPGESLSILADKYLGDKFKYPVIAALNDIDDPTKISVGQKIKIPLSTKAFPGSMKTAGKENAPIMSDYTLALIEQVKSFFESGAYLDSIEESKKVLKEQPENSEAKRFLIDSYYRQGLEFFKDKVYDMAVDFFEKVDEIMPNYKDIKDLLQKSRKALRNFIDDLYKEGITFYREQDLDKALDRWKEVLRLDPDHEGAKKYSEKARLLLEKLQQMEAQ